MSSAQTEPGAIDQALARFALYREVYQTRAADYERLRSCRDYQGRILPALNRIRPLDGLEVVESGAGSGHLTVLLAPQAKSIRAFDISQPLLDIAAGKLARFGRRNWLLGRADHRRLPAESQSADAVLAGYSLCHIVDENLECWRQEVGRALDEMKRVLRPDGTLILLESLGRGDTPQPAAHLVEYFDFLGSLGFGSVRMRTDYRFDSRAEVDSLVRGVFGGEIAGRLLEQNTLILPAWTAFFWLHLSSRPEPQFAPDFQEK